MTASPRRMAFKLTVFCESGSDGVGLTRMDSLRVDTETLLRMILSTLPDGQAWYEASLDAGGMIIFRLHELPPFLPARGK